MGKGGGYKVLFIHDLRFSDPGYNMLYLFLQTSTAIWRTIEVGLSEEHVTLAQLRLLLIVRHHDKPLTPAELCRCVFRESQTVTIALNHLENNGYVKKVKDQNDKRKVRIQITERGKQLLKKHDQWIASSANEIVSCFSKEELQQFEEYLKRLREWVFQLFGIGLVEPIGESYGTMQLVDTNLARPRTLPTK